MLARVCREKFLGPNKGRPIGVAPNAAIPGADGGRVTFTTGSWFINNITNHFLPKDFAYLLRIHIASCL